MSPNARRERRRASAEDRRPLKLHHAFGSQADAGALLLNDDLVMHRVGRWLVSQSIETTAVSTKLSKMSFFFELAPTVTKLTALCTDQNRNFLALCETSHQPDSSEQPSPPQLRIIHSQTHRTICVLSAALDGNFAGCCFSQDGKYVLAYTGEPDHVIVVWHWVEERPLGMFRSRSPLTRVGFNPATSSLLSMCSPMRLARLNESGHFKEIEVSALKRYGGAATDHVWLAAKALVFLDSGTARVVEDSALKQSITREVMSTHSCMHACSRSFNRGRPSAAHSRCPSDGPLVARLAGLCAHRDREAAADKRVRLRLRRWAGHCLQEARQGWRVPPHVRRPRPCWHGSRARPARG